MPEVTKELLRSLAEKPTVNVAIISGRSVHDLKQRIGLPLLIYAGNHGLEIEGPDFRFVEPAAQKTRPVLDQIHRILKQALSPLRGVIVEHKGLSLTVHYRMVEGSAMDDFRRLFEQKMVGVRSLGRIKVTSGKKVHEVRPAVPWDKGKAISLLLERFAKVSPGERTVAIFLGDDSTDEDGFKVLRRNGGITVFVGQEERPSAAEYFLRSPTEVQELLRRMVFTSWKGLRGSEAGQIDETWAPSEI